MKNLELYRAIQSAKENQQTKKNFNPEAVKIPICPRLIDQFADYCYNAGYKSYVVQTASVSFRVSLYKSFISTLKPEEMQISIFDEIQIVELK